MDVVRAVCLCDCVVGCVVLTIRGWCVWCAKVLSVSDDEEVEPDDDDDNEILVSSSSSEDDTTSDTSDDSGDDADDDKDDNEREVPLKREPPSTSCDGNVIVLGDEADQIDEAAVKQDDNALPPAHGLYPE